MSDAIKTNKSAAENNVLAALLISLTVFLIYSANDWLSYFAASLTAIFSIAVVLKKYKYYSWISMYSFAIILINIVMIIAGEFQLQLSIASSVIGLICGLLSFRLSKA